VFGSLFFFFYLQLMINDSILKLIDWIAHHEHDNIFFFLLCEYIFVLLLGIVGFLLGKVEIKFNIKLKSYQELWEKLNKSEKKYKR